MLFAHDTTAALVLAADLVNTDELADVAALEVLLDQHLVEPRRSATAADLDAVHALRPRLRALWQAAPGEPLAALVNDLLRDSDARPRLTDHGGGWGWHLHVTGRRRAAGAPDRRAGRVRPGRPGPAAGDGSAAALRGAGV